MPENGSRDATASTGLAALESMHRLLLEALRHREQEIVRYLAILGPALGGFVWLLHSGTGNVGVFVGGTLGVLLLLLLGATYSLALGYNYRYVTLELAKLEATLEIRSAMLEGWPKTPKEFLDRYRLLRCMPWCTPPEVIRVFWCAFLIGITGVTATACAYAPATARLWPILLVGGISLFLSWFLLPARFGQKLHGVCKQEEERGIWPASGERASRKDAEGQKR